MADDTITVVEDVVTVTVVEDTVTVLTVGAQGPPGIPGNETYIHTQMVPASVWTITHNLGTYPSVTIVDSGNSVVLGEVTYVSLSQLVLTFTAAFGGKAYLN